MSWLVEILGMGGKENGWGGKGECKVERAISTGSQCYILSELILLSLTVNAIYPIIQAQL